MCYLKEKYISLTTNFSGTEPTKMYTIHPEKVTYIEAVDLCLSLGEKLAEPKNVDDNDEIVALAKSIQSGVWIGIDDLGIEGDFAYASDGESIGFTNWMPNNPDNAGGNENCVIYGKHNGFVWNDVKCSAKNSFVCESEHGEIQGEFEIPTLFESHGQLQQNYTIYFSFLFCTKNQKAQV